MATPAKSENKPEKKKGPPSRSELFKELGFEKEKLEVRRRVILETDWPKPFRSYRIDYESENHNVEEMYYWLVGHAHYDFGMPELMKITDSQAASVGSSQFGDMQARLGAQQGNASNYMGVIGKLMKDLFSLVRELRQLKERLGYYSQSYEKDPKQAAIAESTLKDVWITLVEGGTNNGSSVYGMAQKVGFTVLPDLFFEAPPMKEEDLPAYIEKKKKEYNLTVVEALARKLQQFYVWKKHTYQELTNKRKFQVAYLRQHFEVIRMYMNWIKPYLRNVKRLGLSEGEQGMDDPLLINSFDTSRTEIEVLVLKKEGDLNDYADIKKKNEDAKKADPNAKEILPDPKLIFYSVISFHFLFHTKPQLMFHAKESYQQKGAIHIGKTEATIRLYAWTKEQIDGYKKYRNLEAFDIFSSFDKGVKDAMDFLGDELNEFLAEAELEIAPKKEEKTAPPPPPRQESGLDFVISPFFGLFELFSPIVGGIGNPFGGFADKGAAHAKDLDDKKKALKKKSEGTIKMVGWNCYKNYKKSHRMWSW
ncbi:MAG TPA: hypothetical protein VK158_05115 [Acidobacteriota bacterium]|nr:hypothetical protein [Acidobacteriota bacterium]